MAFCIKTERKNKMYFRDCKLQLKILERAPRRFSASSPAQKLAELTVRF
jgi:hypothetical protein